MTNYLPEEPKSCLAKAAHHEGWTTRFRGGCILLATLLAMGGQSFWRAEPVAANAPPCYPEPSGVYTCWSVLNGNDSGQITGVWGQWNTYIIHYGSARHVNNTIWLKLSNGDEIEMGICYGILGTGCTGTGSGTYAIDVYWKTKMYWSHSMPMDGSLHTFYMASWGTNTWNFYLDGQKETSIAESTSYGLASTASTGGEVEVQSQAAFDSTIYTGSFNNYVQENDSTGWHPWGAGYVPGVYEACTDTQNTNCMNGWVSQWSQWDWNKVS